VVGVGIGNYLASARPLYQVGTPFYAHNLYLDIAVELGLIGLAVFLLMLFSAVGPSFRQPTDNFLAPTVAASLAVYMVHSLFETALFSLHVTVTLVFLLALSSVCRSREAW
jgi:O-antigen ligase